MYTCVINSHTSQGILVLYLNRIHAEADLRILQGGGGGVLDRNSSRGAGLWRGILILTSKHTAWCTPVVEMRGGPNVQRTLAFMLSREPRQKILDRKTPPPQCFTLFRTLVHTLLVQSDPVIPCFFNGHQAVRINEV